MSGEIIKLNLPNEINRFRELNAGDIVHVSGEILVFRDQVHRILCELIEAGKELPFGIKGQTVYYCGPTPARPGSIIGSAGPTTSGRMDKFMEPMLKSGLAASIGKGNRSPKVRELLSRYGSVYFTATGGAGAYYSKKITEARVIAFPELGPEAAYIFRVEDMPLVVGIDSKGVSAFI